ncbi:MAG: hypothetical protein WCO11_05320 [Sphingomonadales bacterium]|jgi:hypothetical protein
MMTNVEMRPPCPVGGSFGETVNVKFFRGTRDDIITADEILEQAKSAAIQKQTGQVSGSPEAPRSAHRSFNVLELVKTL